MERYLHIMKRILFPHIAVVLISIPIAVTMLIYAFVWEDVKELIVYASYVFSFYTLVITCVRVPEVYKALNHMKQNNKYVVRYRSDVHLRIKISLLGSVVINVLYAVWQLFLGFHFHSVWFYALSGYYGLLVAMRGILLRDTLKSAPGEHKQLEYERYRFCGILLLVMNLTLVVIVAYIVWQNRGFAYHYIHTIAMATYTFATLSMAIYNVIKYRRYDSPLLSAAKATSLAAALVSMLSLETAMLTAFGEENQESFRQIITGCTGAVVCSFILGMAVYMIVRANKGIRKMKELEEGKE